MSDFEMELPVTTGPEPVFAAVATVQGVRRWWTPIVAGSADLGGELHLGFEGIDEEIVMRVDRVEEPSLVGWKCLGHSNDPAWAGSTVTFEIRDSALRIRHSGVPRERVAGGWAFFGPRLVTSAASRSPHRRLTFDAIATDLLAEPGVTEGTGFGSTPGLRVAGRIFAMSMGGELVVKLPADRCAAIAAAGAARPMKQGTGRPMREWVVVGEARSDEWPALALEALAFVRG